MTNDKPKKRMGRPPRDPSSAPGGSGARVYHLGLRFNDARRQQLERIAAAMTEKARAAGVPLDVTVSSIVHSWIVSKIDESIAALDAAEKRKR